MIETIRWRNGHVELIDQTLLPGKVEYIDCNSAEDIWAAIKKMNIRGAPAIGIAGAYGVYLGIKDSHAVDFRSFEIEVERVVRYLAGSRPTARNLFWGLERVKNAVLNAGVRYAGVGAHCNVPLLKDVVLNEAHAILEEDRKICRDIGKFGAALIPKGARILTHCNAGALATADYGTALGVIFSAKKKIKKVYVDETRPLLQGARLTAWELVNNGIKTTLICDNMAASLMAKGEIDAVIVGADRIAANGDTANKIGTYSVAIAASYHKVPFYVAAPLSTFDLSLSDGSAIPIEERDKSEVRMIGDKLITVKDVDVKNPAFDVTPAGLITAIITECGIIRKPNKKSIKRIADV